MILLLTKYVSGLWCSKLIRNVTNFILTISTNLTRQTLNTVVSILLYTFFNFNSYCHSEFGPMWCEQLKFSFGNFVVKRSINFVEICRFLCVIQEIALQHFFIKCYSFKLENSSGNNESNLFFFNCDYVVNVKNYIGPNLDFTIRP